MKSSPMLKIAESLDFLFRSDNILYSNFKRSLHLRCEHERKVPAKKKYIPTFDGSRCIKM